MMADQQDDLRALLNDSGEPTLERAIAKAREAADRLENITLSIAVTGESGAGKSSFVNAIRGLQDTDEGAAETGVTECTRKPTMYPHPSLPNVKIWDLPGIGTLKFKAETYLKNVKYENFDFFIIVSAGRFKENDMMLAQEIKKMNKNFYFVRTKTDIDVANEERKKGRKEVGKVSKETLDKIRDDCKTNLQKLGLPPVFLITCHDLSIFDFQKLVNTLRNELPKRKRDALIMSLPVCSKQSLDDKYSLFKDESTNVAILSGSVGAIPIPGLSTAYDVILVVGFLTKCYRSFGLDDDSLKKLSERVNKPILEEVQNSALVRAIATKKSLARQVAARLVAAGVVESLCNLVPVAGSIAAAGVSYVTTRSVLLEGLKELHRVAEKVIEMAGLK